MKLSRFTSVRPAEAIIDVLGEPVKVVYDRALINDGFWKSEPLWRPRLAKLLLSWDIIDEATGKPYMPPEGANGNRPAEWLTLLAPMADDLLLIIYEGIFDDHRAGPKARAGSTAT